MRRVRRAGQLWVSPQPAPTQGERGPEQRVTEWSSQRVPGNFPGTCAPQEHRGSNRRLIGFEIFH